MQNYGEKDFIMQNNESDAKKFLKTMWVMMRGNILPWALVAGIIALGIIGSDKAKSSDFGRNHVKKSELFQKQR